MFILKFKEEERKYIYDVISNHILEVDDIFFDLIEHIKDGNSNERHGYKYSEHIINKMREEVERYRKERGIFENKKISKFIFPFSLEEYKLMLKNLLNHVILNITEDCNNRCEYCKYSGEYFFSRTHSKKYMSEFVAIKAIKFIIENSVYILKNTDEKLSIGFYGGEPLLNFKVIKECVDYVKINFDSICDRINFAMTTNLTILNKEIIDFLVKNNFSLLVSLDGPKDIHDRYRKSISGKGTFNLVIKNLMKIRETSYEYYKNKVGFSIVLSPPYDLNSVVDFFERIDFLPQRVVLLSFVDDEDTKFFDRFKNMDKINEDLKEQWNQLKSEYKELLISEQRETSRYKLLSCFFEERLRDIHRRNLIQPLEKVYPNGICLPGIHKFLVSPEGKFYICEKIGYSFSIGDIYNGFDIDAIFSLINEYIKISEPVCLDCWAIRFCKACFLRAMKGERLDSDRKRENCIEIKSSILSALKLYCWVMKRNPKALDFIKKTENSRGILDVAFKFISDFRNSSKYFE